MNWEEMTANEFEIARETCKGCCLIPMGVVEKHGQHLPLSTDMIIAREVCERTARIEPSVVFPDYYFGQISEARQVPGTISISPELQMKLLTEVCDEIGRNGFKKIILVNFHGGNELFLKYFTQSILHTKKDYAVYYIDVFMLGGNFDFARQILGTDDLGGHGGNLETAPIMAVRPDLVKMDCIEKEGLINLGRLNHLYKTYSGIWWYADHPTHFDGDPSLASAKTGNEILDEFSKECAKAVGIIKNDNVVQELLNEYYSKSE